MYYYWKNFDSKNNKVEIEQGIADVNNIYHFIKFQIMYNVTITVCIEKNYNIYFSK